MNRISVRVCILATAGAMTLSACGSDNAPDAVVGGTVTGLGAGASVMLQENNSTVLSVSGSTAFEFPATVAPNAPFTVAVVTQPSGASCSVTNGSGMVDAAGDAVQDVLVHCTPNTTVGGSVSGLTAGNTLTLTDGTTAVLATANGSFVFGDLYAVGASYNVSVVTPPNGESCTLSNSTGTIDAAGDMVNNIGVSCAASATLGGTVAGLSPNASVTLGDGVTALPVASNGAFAFSDSFAPGAPYQVTIISQPAGQTCALGNSAGAFDANADAIGNVNVACTTNGTVGGTVVGLAANSVLSLTDGTSTLAVTANGSFAFTDLYPPGAAYTVSVASQPSGQSCTLQGGGGTLDANDDAVTNLVVSCN